jgi:hypothetical protein
MRFAIIPALIAALAFIIAAWPPGDPRRRDRG